MKIVDLGFPYWGTDRVVNSVLMQTVSLSIDQLWVLQSESLDNMSLFDLWVCFSTWHYIKTILIIFCIVVLKLLFIRKGW